MRAESLHVTLVFLGWREEAEADAIAAAAFAAAESGSDIAPRLSPGRLRPLPARRPRLFALELEDEGGRAGAIQAAASTALEAGGWYRPEASPRARFWPHLTLARVRRGESRPAPLAGRPPPRDPFDTPALTLYHSQLRPQGALYEPLARLAL